MSHTNSDRTWRWCFYVNLPLGGFAILVTLAFLHVDRPQRDELSALDPLRRFDPMGILCLVPAIICLMLALQWGGTIYAWKSSHIIGLFVGAGLLFLIFIAVEVQSPAIAIAPMRVVLNRSVAGAMTYTFLLSGGMTTVIYYLAIWFQVAKGDTAIHAGVSTIPMLLALVVASCFGAAFTQKVGYYVPPMLLSSILCAIGAGLLSTLKPDSYHGYWMGYQVLYGFGIGIGFQNSNLAVQNVLKRADVPLGMAVMFLMQQLGGAVFLAVAQGIFSNALLDRLSGVASLNAERIINTGATDLRNIVPSDELDMVIMSYSFALTRTFLMTAVISAVMLVGPFAMEWKNIKVTKAADAVASSNQRGEKADGH